MIFFSSLIIAGGLVYSSNDHAGALLIAGGCALAFVKWLADHLPQWRASDKRSE